MIPHERLAHAGTALAASSVAAFVAVAVLGPSAASPRLPGAGPARSFDLHPADSLVAAGMWVALGCGAAAVLLWWLALRDGWQPSIHPIAAWGVVGAAAMAAVPPLGSSDLLSYGAYGRMVVLGLNPYTTETDGLAAIGDPVGLAYRGGWLEAPSVYGPVASGIQGAGSWVSGTSMKLFVLVMQLLALGAFLLTAWLLHRSAAEGRSRARVGLLWLANPLVMYLVVNSAHLDGVAIALGLAALLVLQRSPAAAGVLAAAATCTKISSGLYALALLWAARSQRRALLQVALFGLATSAALVVPFLPEILDPLRTASTYLAAESAWWGVHWPLEDWLGATAGARLLSLMGWLLMAVLVWRLALLVPKRTSGRPMTDEALWAAVVLAFAWLLSTTYALPWYDVSAWAPLLLLPASAVDLLLLGRTLALGLGYAPGVTTPPAGWLSPVAESLRRLVTPVATTLLVALVVVAPRRLRPSPPRAHLPAGEPRRGSQ